MNPVVADQVAKPWYETYKPQLIGAGIVAAASLVITSFALTAKFIGTSSTWNFIGSKLTSIWMVSMFGSLLLFFASALYFKKDDPWTIYFILILLCLTLGFSYSALAVSAITSG